MQGPILSQEEFEDYYQGGAYNLEKAGKLFRGKSELFDMGFNRLSRLMYAMTL